MRRAYYYHASGHHAASRALRLNYYHGRAAMLRNFAKLTLACGVYVCNNSSHVVDVLQHTGPAAFRVTYRLEFDMAKSEVVVSPVVANVLVTEKINAANESAKTADAMAREAATLANESDYVDEGDAGKRLDSILALYAGVLTHKAVKESFSAALAILVADKPVRVESSAVTTLANGRMTFKAPEILAPVAEKNEVLNPEKTVTELAAGDAVMKLAADTMKAAATAARESIGRGRATGGGRKSTKDAPRAPWFDELSGVINDHGLRVSMFAVIQTKAKADDKFREELAECLRNCGMEVFKAGTMDAVRAKLPKVAKA